MRARFPRTTLISPGAYGRIVQETSTTLYNEQGRTGPGNLNAGRSLEQFVSGIPYLGEQSRRFLLCIYSVCLKNLWNSGEQCFGKFGENCVFVLG